MIISNMMSSIPAYNDYARNVLEPAMDQAAPEKIKALEAAGKYKDPQYIKGRYLLCTNGSHLDIYDDQQVYMKGMDDRLYPRRRRKPLLSLECQKGLMAPPKSPAGCDRVLSSAPMCNPFHNTLHLYPTCPTA